MKTNDTRKSTDTKLKVILLLSLAIIIAAAMLTAVFAKLLQSSNQAGTNTEPVTASRSEVKPQTARERIAAYANANGFTIDDYPKKLIALLKKEPESERFVLDYPAKKGTKASFTPDEFDYSKGIPLFIQWDTRWGYSPIGKGIIGLNGCGPTCLSMLAVYYFRDNTQTPDVIARFALDNGYYSDSFGSSWDLFTRGAAKLGLSVKGLSSSEKLMKNSLDDGNAIVCSMGPGDFTAKGHYIVITGYTDDGFSVNDPNSPVNSSKSWPFSKIEKQIKNLWAISR